MRIVIYSTTTCPKCKQLKSYLEEKGQSYEEVLLDRDPSRLSEFQQIAPDVTTVPVTAIYHTEENDPQVVPGFETAQIDKALSL